MTYTFLIIDTLALLTIVGQLIIALLLVLALPCIYKMKISKRVWYFVSDHGLILMFIVALIATSGSLFFSEIALFAPCKDCWIQRIFMYPQVVLLAVALWRKERNIAYYILPLCILGILMSGEHYAEQWKALLDPLTNDPLKPCDLSGVSCRATYLFEYGYITIPLMAGTAFALNILGSLSMIVGKSDR